MKKSLKSERDALINNDSIPTYSEIYGGPSFTSYSEAPPSFFSAEGQKQFWKKNFLFAVFFVLFIISNTGQIVYLAVSLQYAVPNFPFWFFWATAMPFVIVFMLLMLGTLLFTKSITPEMRKISHKKWAFMGLMNCLNGFCLLFAAPHVATQLQSLLGPTIVTIPMSMVCSALFLKRRYNVGQIASVVVILGGVVIALWPTIYGGGSLGDGKSVLWDLLFLLGSLPISIMMVYEEKVFIGQPVNMAWMIAWLTLYQFIFILIIATPLSLIPGFGSQGAHGFWQHQRDGFLCFAGYPVESCPECQCEIAGTAVGVFILMYVVTNFTQMGIVKYGNATFSFIASTLGTPLSFFAFTSNALTLGNATPTNMFSYIALAVLLLSVIAYRFFDHMQQKKLEKLGIAPPAHGH